MHFLKVNFIHLMVIFFALGFYSSITYAHRSYNNHRHGQHRPAYPNHRIKTPRFGHRYYALPYGYTRLIFGSRHFFYRGGIFLRHVNGEYVVVQAPIGVVVQTLPADYSILMIDGRKYYVIDDTYFIRVKNGYKVSSIPEVSDEEDFLETGTETGTDATEITTNEGHTESHNADSNEKQAIDNYECHRWGVSQSNYDPTLEDSKADGGQLKSYRAAKATCLKMRGYSN